MRSLLCALFALSSVAVAEAQSGAPLHHAARKVGHKYRATKAYVRHGLHATTHYVGHKYRGVKKAIKN